MRQIKFRGKCLDNGEWVYGYFYEECENTYIIEDRQRSMNDILARNIPYKVNPDTIGQFTGLLDKNGKEVYEGDIIGCHNPDIKHLIFYEEKQGRFMAALNGDIENSFIGVCGLDSSRWNALKEVIGNIHDNPELLKGGTK